MKETIEINIGEGIGNITFTHSEDELIHLIGKPNFIDEDGVSGKVLSYSSLNLGFVFDPREDRQGIKTIEIESKNFTLWGEAFIGKSLDDIEKLIQQRGYLNYRKEGGFSHSFLFIEDIGLDIEFENNIASILYLNPLNPS